VSQEKLIQKKKERKKDGWSCFLKWLTFFPRLLTFSECLHSARKCMYLFSCFDTRSAQLMNSFFPPYTPGCLYLFRGKRCLWWCEETIILWRG
jgi:hypothetical protein